MEIDLARLTIAAALGTVLAIAVATAPIFHTKPKPPTVEEYVPPIDLGPIKVQTERVFEWQPMIFAERWPEEIKAPLPITKRKTKRRRRR